MYPGRFTCWRVIVQWIVERVAGDVLEDAIVGGRRPPRVVFGLEAVDGDDDLQAWNVAPLERYLAHGARDDLHVNPAFRQQRQQRVQLAVADERLAADNRQMKRPVPIDEREDAVDELLALEVADLPQRQLPAEVVLAVGIAARTLQRTLARDLDGKRRRVSRQHATPRGKNPVHRGQL